jgi:hypothetical protein
MKILKKENWWIWLLLMIFSSSSSMIVLGALLDVYEKDAWYTKWYYWIFGLVCFGFPAAIMASVFSLTITCKTAAKLEVPGSEIYLSPYIWILCLIVPIIGWIMFIVMALYISIWPLVMLYNGKGEKYIN